MVKSKYADILAAHRSKSKYRNVRTEYNGVWYDSKAEALWARDLDYRMRDGEVLEWHRQTKVQVGPQITTVVDFSVRDRNGWHYEEVKGGIETPKFKMVRRWWPKYGSAPLWICKRQRNKWSVEKLEGGEEDE